MKNWMKLFGLFALLLLVVACSTEQPGSSSDDSEGDSGDSGNGEDTTKVGLSISTLNNPFFVSLRDGAEAAAEEAGFEITTADAQNDAATQVSDIEDLLQQEIDVLLVNPTDSAAVVSAIESANDSGVPVITVDRTADGGDVVTHIASDNVAGGEMAGNFIAEQLNEEGQVVELEGIPGASATRERGEGFHNVVDSMDGIEIVANQSANFDRSEGLTVMENILQSTESLDAVFAHNDEMALGAVQALESNNMLEDVTVVGFDATDDARAAVSEGRMDATVAQQPELIGQKAIDAAGKVAKDEQVEEFIPVELQLVTE
ncbi:D-ribose ABC transporter substrate-binding protein [Halobacillus halophilus]|uniref:ABC-type transport system extracellular binding protein (Probable substrate ribose) n=1 Tax=Halobacillus halophilus (strain ATCC 35676 / DSM 2266 / JCM 20832 / KCTC 3685 / LMG 17431 / NBRC 102448 / NCIMB 2269) TaxID=866895 RepID=I0JTG3_HALH3|nr:ribose ABC transporter substrate-binding protein RbsB [Halobacillus halophilus]ASF41346.1 D-ribose ABC transporter substrate-binding protein [Halobacillus halophilus]CCG47435.1 ABC-type transport system extracellular binding protein (probable substrate ribose) [Halobacillus halophilus DSM 2266]